MPDFEAMRSLPRHVLVHSDGRRLLVYGELHGSLDEDGPGAARDGAEIHKRFDVFTEAWVGIAPARNTRPLDSLAESADAERCPFCPGGIEVPFRTTRPSSTTGSRHSVPSRRRRRASTARPDRRRGAARSFSTRTDTTPRSASCRRPSSPASSRSGSTADASSGRIPRTNTSASSRTGAPRSAPPSRTRTGRSTRSITSRRSRRRSRRPTAATADGKEAASRAT